MRAASAVAVLFLVAPTVNLQGQGSPIQPGTNVQVDYDCGPQGYPSTERCKGNGRLEAVTAEHLVLIMDGRSTRVLIASVKRLRLYAGRGVSAGRAIGFPAMGLLAGGLAGGLIGYATCAPCDYELEGMAVAIGAVVGGCVGFVAGLVVGLLPRDRWKDVSLEGLRVNVVPQRDGRIALGLTVTF
jgi:hypothetical protein